MLQVKTIKLSTRSTHRKISKQSRLQCRFHFRIIYTENVQMQQQSN